MSSGLGKMEWSDYSTRLQDSAAIEMALQNGDFKMEKVEESDSFSSLSILLLPIVLALLPIALFQDAKVIATVLYAVVTDVVSVLPIAIKGVELVVYGSQHHYAFNSNMYGTRNGSLSSAEDTCAAECDMKPFVRQKGIGLLTLACTAMTIGIVLGVTVRRCAAKRRKELAKLAESIAFEQESLLKPLPLYSAGKQER